MVFSIGCGSEVDEATFSVSGMVTSAADSRPLTGNTRGAQSVRKRVDRKCWPQALGSSDGVRSR